jgi:prevent-host-death family protein
MTESISQRELRNDNAVIMRRVEAGESFTVTRNGRPIADLVPHQGAPKLRTMGEIQEIFRKLPPMDLDEWRRDRARDDEFFGADEPTDPWSAR